MPMNIDIEENGLYKPPEDKDKKDRGEVITQVLEPLADRVDQLVKDSGRKQLQLLNSIGDNGNEHDNPVPVNKALKKIDSTNILDQLEMTLKSEKLQSKMDSKWKGLLPNPIISSREYNGHNDFMIEEQDVDTLSRSD